MKRQLVSGLGVVGIALSAGAAHGAERSFSIADFERIRAEGPFNIIVETGKGTAARATGAADALDRVDIQVQGRMLVIRPNRSSWGGWSNKASPAAAIRITVPLLKAVSMSGSGSISISKMRHAQLKIWFDGSGSLSVGTVEADRLDVTAQGSGKMKLAGRAAQAFVLGAGPTSVDAAALKTRDLQLTWQSAGNITIAADRTAKVTSAGSGNVTIEGKPACTVNAVGSGEVSCGK